MEKKEKIKKIKIRLESGKYAYISGKYDNDGKKIYTIDLPLLHIELRDRKEVCKIIQGFTHAKVVNPAPERGR